MAKLGEVCIQITDGSHNPPSGVEQSEYLMLSSKNIDDDFITLDSPRFLSHSDYIAENKRTTVSEGDLLMTIVGTIGRVAIVPKELKGICLQRSVAVIKPEREVVNNRYLMYQLQNMRPFLEKEARGVAQKGIYLKQVSQLDIKIPELEHQMQIVKVLDKASKLIFLRRQQLAKMDELVKARFVEMFGEPVQNPNCWKTENLLDLGYCKNGMNFHRDDCGTEIHCLGVGDFKNHSTIRDVGSLPFISLNELPTSEYLLQDGDIVFVRSNGNKELVGRCLAIYPAKIPVTYSGFCIRYRLTSNKITVSYLLSVLKADSVRKKMTGRGANIQNLNQQILAQLVVPIPPLSLQNQFAAFVERVDQQKQTVQQSLEKLELMKKALMQEYFG